MEQRRMANGYGIFSLWANWALGIGALIIVLVLSPVVDKAWLPLVVFTIELFMYALVRHNREAHMPVCYLVPFICTRVLFWSAVIMVIINILYQNNVLAIFVDEKSLNPEIPYISVLIMAPVALLVTFWANHKRQHLMFCKDCTFRNGTPAERGFLGKLFSQEGHYQVRAFMLFALLLTIAEWLYYVFVYINVNLNRPDRFFYVWIPVAFYVLSLIYLGIRYFSLWTYYCQNIEGSPLRQGSMTLLRIIIISGDHIFLKLPNPLTDDVKSGEERYDTPARLALSYRSRFTEYDAETNMVGLSGIVGSDLRLMYQTNNFNTDSNIYHYACFVDDKSLVETSRLQGEWFTMPQIEQMLAEGRVAPILGSELNRIYTISMAWKTYDRAGYRLYKMRNYKPTFRLRDFKDWDVDLNDIQWLYVAANNEDKLFFRLKRMWRRYINGLGE